MASGDTLFFLDPLASKRPGTLFALLGFVEDASTPTIVIPVLRFETGSPTWRHWIFQVPSHYDGGGFTFSWKGGTDDSSTGTLELEFGVVKIADATVLTGDLGLDTATRVGISDTPPASPTDKLNYSGTGTLTHAQVGSPSAGDLIAIAVVRDTTTDTNTGFLQMAEGLITET